MEKIIKKLLIIGCGRLGQTAGKFLSKLPLEVIGIKRQLSKLNSPFKILALDIFSDNFSDKIKLIDPDFLIYSVSSDFQTEESYRKNYVEGLKITINAVDQLKSFQHLFFISSTRVYGQPYTNKVSGISEAIHRKDFFSELTTPQPKDFGGRILLEAENCLNKLPFKTTILRPSGIYGDDRRHMLRMASDLTKWPPEDRWTNRIHEEDVASFINFLFTEIINNKEIKDLYLLTDNQPVSLYEVLEWIRIELGLSLDKSPLPNANVINGKKLKSEILPKLKFSLKHSNYKSGYRQMISKMKKTN